MQSFLKHIQENKLYALIKLYVLIIPQYLHFTTKYRYCYVKQTNIFFQQFTEILIPSNSFKRCNVIEVQ